MANHPARSPSIPIPRNPATPSSARNIESVISIPNILPSRPRLSSTQGISARSGTSDMVRNISASHRPTHDSISLSVSPTRRFSRSVTLSGNHLGRPSPRMSTTFEPRIVHASPDSARNNDDSCAPPHPPIQLRRASGVGGRSVSAQRMGPSIPPLPNATPVSFPRPTYLDHSALRDLLVTETSSPPLVGVPLATQRKVETAGPSTSAPSQSYAMSPSTDSDEDSSPSPPPPSRDVRTVPTSSVISEEQVTYPLPTRWDDQARLGVLTVSHDGRDLSHYGANSNEKEHAANARANHFVPPACGIYYYEVEIRSKEQKSQISIGFCLNHVKYSCLPGWELKSWGYHGDDGNAYEGGRPGGATYASAFGSGDIIGCGIDFTNHKIFYTKNQTFLGFVFDGVGKEGDLYPVVGLRRSGDCVRVNFGHDSFAFDIENHVQERCKATWSSIMKTPLNSTLLRRRYHKNAIKSLITITEPPSALTEDESKSVLSQLVLSYLVHHGYAKAARAFHKQQQSGHGKPQEDDVEMDGTRMGGELDDFEGDIERRTAIVDSVMRGDIDTTLEEIRKYYPAVLEADDGLVLFKLRCRKLVELILETNEIKRGISNGKEREESPADVSGSNPHRRLLDDDGMNMDVDDDALDFAPSVHPSLHQYKSTSLRSPSADGRSTSRPATAAEFEAALTAAIEYGQNFNNDYKLEKRPELRQMFEQASSVIAWNNPFEAGGDAAGVAGQEARIVLANEVNEAILKSLGQPVRPTLEMVYRHTATCLTQLGLAGVGSAVFADVPKELLEP